MRGEGFSIREIARELGLSRKKVHRVLMVSPPVAAVEIVPVDPVLRVLTEQDLKHAGVTAAAAGGLSALDRYRIQGLRAADAARVRPLPPRDEDWAPERGEPMPAHVRDQRIVELRRDGWTLEQIGDALNMTKSGVSRALERILMGRPGQQPRG